MNYEQWMRKYSVCNNCGCFLTLSLVDLHEVNGLMFCCGECADIFFQPDNPDPYPIGLAYDLGLEE